MLRAGLLSVTHYAPLEVEEEMVTVNSPEQNKFYLKAVPKLLESYL